jgi:hypothetical protein
MLPELWGFELGAKPLAPLLEAAERRGLDLGDETRQLLGVLLALAPWLAFLIAVIWSEVSTRLDERMGRRSST